MYAWIRCINGFEKELTYSVPEALQHMVHVGSVVNAPLQNRTELGLVTRTAPVLPESVTFKIRPLSSVLPFPIDPSYATFVHRLGTHYFVPIPQLYQRLRSFLASEQEFEPTVTPTPELARALTLSAEQQAAADYLAGAVTRGTFEPVLLHGVTGSGKTEVYRHAIMQAHAEGKTTLFMLPEVSLCAQFSRRLRASLPAHIPLYDFHSASKTAQKRALWQALCTNMPVVILGVHLPVLLPIGNLGLIIVDEEHEQGFVEKKNPRINSKEAALLRAQTHQVPIVLGSATPSVQTLALAEQKNWQRFAITQRFSGNFPRIKQVVMTAQPKGPGRTWSWLSKELVTAVKATLARGEQVMLFLNRRGYSFFIQCKGCGYVAMCPACSVSLTLHQLGDTTTLQCHYCTSSKPLPACCPECKADAKQFLKKGIGTQYLVDLCSQLFPAARIARADLDNSRQQGAWQKTVTDFSAGKIDILVGTQTITKGYDFPGVTLVGIIWADISLHFPQYNAAETTLQQLIQVAGRAGRHTQDSLVIVQTMREHPIFDYLDEMKYLAFCQEELAMRRLLGYPPFVRMAQLELRHTDEQTVEQNAALLAEQAHLCAKETPGLLVLGPSLPVVHKIAHTQLRHLTLKAPSHSALHKAVSTLMAIKIASQTSVVL